MSVLLLLIPVSILVAGGFLCAFLWAVRSGQYEDTTTPPMRVLWEEGEDAVPERPGEGDTKRHTS